MNSPKTDPTGLLARLWLYQSERFPVFRTALLLIAFSASSVTASAQLAGRSLPGFSAYLIAFLLVFFFFWQLRAADEMKDAEVDKKYRPERPVPRGLVSLKLILGLGVASMIIAAVAAFLYYPPLLWLVLGVWLWMALMTVEFFVPALLHRSALLLLITHMAVMPLIDLVLTGCEWLPHGLMMPKGLWTFILMSLANGCIFEFGRKIWAPENERVGVETYSSAWGVRPSLAALSFVWLLAFLALIGLSLYHGQFWLFTICGLIAGAPLLYQMLVFYQKPTAKAQKRLDDFCGLWMLLCYLLAALLPFFKGWNI